MKLAISKEKAELDAIQAAESEQKEKSQLGLAAELESVKAELTEALGAAKQTETGAHEPIHFW